MKRKSIIIMLGLVIPQILIAVRPSTEQMEFYNATTHGALIMEHIRVVDQDSIPVEAAKIWGGIQTGNGYHDYISVDGYTNTNGEFMVRGKCTNLLSLRITKNGYYTTEFQLSYRDATTETPKVRDGKWQPYNSQRVIILKKIVNPCPMVKDDGSCKKPPKLDEWIGYDLELNQWVAPYGSGRHSDVLIRIHIDAVNDISDFKTSMEVSFTNNPYAGAYRLSKDSYSEMQSVYNADTDAAYLSSFLFVHERHPIFKQKPIVYVEGVNENDTRLDKKSYLVFRTRTEVDENGNLVSAHYGKINGLWEFFGSMRAASILFNPTPNDTNLEDEYTAERSRKQQRQREAPPYKRKHKSIWPF